MAKITVTLEAAKLRELLFTETYTNKEGKEVSVQKVRFELVEVKEPKTVYTGAKHRLDKTHFAAVIQTKEQREARADTVFLGEGVTTVWLNDQPTQSAPNSVDSGGGDSSLPF